VEVGRSKRVRFTEHVEIRRPGALTKQLDRRSSAQHVIFCTRSTQHRSTRGLWVVGTKQQYIQI
jgi:hypothetical protein